MIEEKPWYLSKTIWGALIAVVASLLGALGVRIGLGDQQQIADAMVQLVTAGGSLLAIYGRLTATETIS